MKNFLFREFIICTILPFVIPFINEIPNALIAKPIRFVIIGICFAFNIYFARKYYKKMENENLINFSNKINKESYFNACEICERKREFIVSKTYQEDYHIPQEWIPYDVHNYIAEICKNLCNTISQITSMDKRYMDVTFIYRYKYDNNDMDACSWRWVVGKAPTTTVQLDEFVNKEKTLYNYLVNGDNGKFEDSVFCNDKTILEEDGHYHMSKRDRSHNKIGSIFAAKIAFGNNATQFVESILVVSSYGKRFIEDEITEYNESELKNLIFEELFPYYQKLLETELGMLYLRHKRKKTDKNRI